MKALNSSNISSNIENFWCWMHLRRPLLFPRQIWKQPHWIKCSDQFRINKRDADCFEHRHEENTKLSVSVTVSHIWIFLSTLCFLWFLQRWGEEWRNSNRMGQGCWCSWAVKLRQIESSNPGVIWYMRNETKSISVRVTQFLIYSLFHTWTFIKTEFFPV